MQEIFNTGLSTLRRGRYESPCGSPTPGTDADERRDRPDRLERDAGTGRCRDADGSSDANLGLTVAIWPIAASAAICRDVSPSGRARADAPRERARRRCVVPATVPLRGPDSVQQLAVDGIAAEPGRDDLTAGATFTSSDPRWRRSTRPGRSSAGATATATVTVRVGALEATVPVTVTRFRRRACRSTSPTRSCRSSPSSAATPAAATARRAARTGSGSACWGSSRPSTTRRWSRKAGAGGSSPPRPSRACCCRRRRPGAPRRRPAAGARLARVPADPRWIAAGMPVGKATDPTVARIEIYPDARVMAAGRRQQVVVTAHYTDGSTEDVTRWAQYQSNDTEVAAVADGGRVETRELVGPGGGHGPLPGAGRRLPRHGPARHGRSPSTPTSPSTNVDRRRRAQAVEGARDRPVRALHRRRVHPPGHRSTSPARCPTAEEVQAFVADADPGQAGASWSTACSTGPSTPSYFAIKWADILRNKREGNADYQRGDLQLPRLDPREPGAEHALRPVRPRRSSPPAARPRPRRRCSGIGRLKATDAFVDDTAQVFLGMRLQCAKCHHHPFEKWSQDDYYGFAAFFARVGRKPSLARPADGPRRRGDLHRADRRRSRTRRPGKTMTPEGAGRRRRRGRRPATTRGRSWSTGWPTRRTRSSPGRVVNRYWAHFFGRGIVEPMDDLRLTNPPVEPRAARRPGRRLRQERLRPQAPGPDDLHEPDLRPVERARTSTTPRTSRASPGTIPSGCGAEVLLDAISQVTGRADRLRRAARRAPGRSSCPTRASPRPSSTPSAAPSATRPASASASPTPASARA